MGTGRSESNIGSNKIKNAPSELFRRGVFIVQATQPFASVLFPELDHEDANGFPQDHNPPEVPSRRCHWCQKNVPTATRYQRKPTVCRRIPDQCAWLVLRWPWPGHNETAPLVS